MLVTDVGPTVEDVCMALAPDSARPLVGRSQELTALFDLVGIPAGTPGMVLLGGDAGVGKTRLLTELAARAERDGWQVLVGHCVDSGDIALPYLPFTEVFGQLAARSPGLVEQLVDAHPSVARLLPARRVDGAGPADGADRLDRVELVESVQAALAHLSRGAPVLLVVEDAHWADRSTRDLLTMLFARGVESGVSVVVSYRADDLHRRHPLRTAVAEWGRLPAVTRLSVPPLPDGDVRTLARILAPTPIPEHQLRRIVERSEGNAFFTEELVATADLDGGLPGDLADLLLVRMERLDDDARRLVRAAAVAGRSVSHELLACVTDLEVDALEHAARSAVEAHILVAAPSNRYAFRHALMAEAVYDDLLPGERVRLHAAYAQLLADGRVPSTAAELARHARAAHDLPTALTASIRAGDEAMAVGGPDEAARHYEVALQLVDDEGGVAGMPGSPRVDVVDLTIAAADAAVAAGHVLRAVALVQHALDELPQAAGGDRRGRLLVSLASLCVLIDTGIDLHALTTEALGLVPDAPSALRGALLNLHARACYERNRFDDAAQWAEQALTLGSELGLPDVTSHARTTLANLDVRAGDPDSALRSLEATLAQAQASQDVTTELRATYSLGSFLFEVGRFEPARAAFEHAVERARESGRPWTPYAVEARCMLGHLAYVRGDWDDVATILDVSREAPPPLPSALVTATAVAVPAARGQQDVAAQLLALRESWRHDGLVAVRSGAAELELALAAGDPARAAAVYDAVCATVTRLWRTDAFLAQVRLASLVVGTAARSAGGASAQEHDELLALAAQVAADAARAIAGREGRGGTMGPEGTAWHGRLAAELLRLRWLTQVDPPDPAALEQAWALNVEQFVAFGDAFETARSRARWAAVLRAQGRPAEAAEQVAQARTTAHALGADPLLAELRALGARTPADGAGLAPAREHLTPREQEVLHLVAQGRTNRQVASQLFISEKTVSVHMSNILAKIGAGGRTEAVAIARRRGLLVED
jgi:DNA-binding NarL/FixJ family response regulator